MNSRASSGFPNVLQPPGLHMFPMTEDLVSPSVEVNCAGSSSANSHYLSSLLFNLSVLKDKLAQVQTLVGVLVSPDQSLPESTSMAVASMNSVVQEIIATASSMMFTCQQVALTGSCPGTTTTCTDEYHHHQTHHDRLPQSNFGNSNRCVLSNIGPADRGQSLFSRTETSDCFGESYNNNCNLKEDDKGAANSETNNSTRVELSPGDETHEKNKGNSQKNYDIIELDAADLLAKYTHYCQVCGKGFKRDANLRMHMRAHGDEYKTNAALSNPMKNKGSLLGGGGEDSNSMSATRSKKYSCPQEGCRWNQKHKKFQPLKSIICVKNHYKRSHCPKMYVCKRCNQKQFSVLSDLRTHEKHCGDLKWQCSCGTTFSRKDKLMGHVALFIGHAPVININRLSNYRGKLEQQPLQLQIDGNSSK